MAIEQTDEQASRNPTALTPELLPTWGRPLALATAAMFCISLVFPAVAAFVRDRESWPKWWGVLDVTVALVLAVAAIALLGVTHNQPDRQAEHASFVAYRFLSYGLLVFGVVFMISGDRIVWANCLTGFAWRAWLLVYSLPCWFTALRAGAT
jgi:hypothetical protein